MLRPQTAGKPAVPGVSAGARKVGMKLWVPSRELYVPGRKPVRWHDRDRDRDRDGMNAGAGGGLTWPDAPEDSDLIGEGAVVGEYDDTETEIELTPDIYDEIEPGDVLQVQSTGELMRVASKDGSNVVTVARGHGGTTPEAIPDGGKVRGYRPIAMPAAIIEAAEFVVDMAGPGAAVAYTDKNLTTPSGDGDTTLSVEPQKLNSPATKIWDNFDAANSPTYFVTTSPLGGGAYVNLDNDQEGLAFDGNPAMIAAAKWWLAWKVRLLGGTSEAFQAVVNIDSSNRLTMNIQALAATGQTDIGLLIARVSGGNDTTTVRKRVAHGSVVVAAVYFDGTDLRWKFDDDDEQVAETYAGTLSSVGTGTPFGFSGRGAAPWDLQTFIGGKTDDSDSEAHWQKMMDAHNYLVNRSI